MGIIAMLIESYALDAVWSLITMLMFLLGGGPMRSLFSDNDFVVKVIWVIMHHSLSEELSNIPLFKSLAYFFVVYRVSSGRSWTTQTERKLTTLQWNRDPESATSQTRGTVSRATENI